MISIPENNFYHYSIFYCIQLTAATRTVRNSQQRSSRDFPPDI
ncbi:hypothetical protein T07_11145 [Trichinella nelsoni]|uniref:Uncharacterized protein n=1 Tax=Trichinella nelsoni TaxID=6336 RepID=A0A0V0RBT0_9BILA|nr:hypothetical protein T07_11145 [Trichinella nelsoni]